MCIPKYSIQSVWSPHWNGCDSTSVCYSITLLCWSICKRRGVVVFKQVYILLAISNLSHEWNLSFVVKVHWAVHTSQSSNKGSSKPLPLTLMDILMPPCHSRSNHLTINICSVGIDPLRDLASWWHSRAKTDSLLGKHLTWQQSCFQLYFNNTAYTDSAILQYWCGFKCCLMNI